MIKLLVMKQMLAIGQEISRNWVKHRNSSMAAAIAYRSIFSLAPILVLITMVFWLFQESYLLKNLVDNFAPNIETVNGVDQIINEIGGTIEIGNLIQVDKAGLLIVAVVMIYGASTVFKELSIAINGIWEITEESSVKHAIYQRLLGAVAVLGLMAVLITASLFNWAISQIHQLLGEVVPALASISSLLTYGIMPILTLTVLVLIYKGMPSTKISFRDVWLGSILTAMLMWFGISLMQFAVSFLNYATYWGAAGSLIVFLVGVYYLAMVVLAGAEFTRTYTYRWGSRQRKKLKNK